MRAWSRWQDWGTMLLGIVLIATPFIFGVALDSVAAYTAYVIGGLLVVTGLWTASTEEPETIAETAPLILGAALFVAPWVLQFTGVTEIAWMSWIIGALAVVNAGAELLVLRPQTTTA